MSEACFMGSVIVILWFCYLLLIVIVGAFWVISTSFICGWSIAGANSSSSSRSSSYGVSQITATWGLLRFCRLQRNRRTKILKALRITSNGIIERLALVIRGSLNHDQHWWGMKNKRYPDAHILYPMHNSMDSQNVDLVTHLDTVRGSGIMLNFYTPAK